MAKFKAGDIVCYRPAFGSGNVDFNMKRLVISYNDFEIVNLISLIPGPGTKVTLSDDFYVLYTDIFQGEI